MSHLFFDHLVNLEEVEKEINALVETKEEKEELWQIIDEIVHHQIMGCIFTHLPRENHEEFLEKFHSAPFDHNLFTYLKEKIQDNIETLITNEMRKLSVEILEEIRQK